jgi:hypothetical protein
MPPKALPGDERDKTCVRDEVAPPEPSRLLCEPIGPLKPKRLRRAGRTANVSGRHIQRAADAHDHGNAKPTTILFQPVFLPRGAHRYE